MIKITYLEHSGFAVECDDYVLIFDYYKGNLPQFDKDKKICVFASHVHYDHFKKKIFTWAEEYENIHYILSDDIEAAGPKVLLWYYIMRRRKNSRMAFYTFDFTGKHIDICDPFNLISEKFHTHCPVRGVCRKDLQYISPDAEGSSVEIHLISCILNVDQLFDNLITILLHSRAKRDHHVKKLLRCT